VYTITFNSMGDFTVFFDTEWYRAPSPHQPVPDVRVVIHFVVSYQRQPKEEGMVPPPFTPSKLDFNYIDVGLGPPQISWRIQHEDYVHTELSNIDHHIQRVLKFKTQFFQRIQLNYDNAEALESRLKWDYTTAASTITDTLFGDQSGAANGSALESGDHSASGNPSTLLGSAHAFSAQRELRERVKADPNGVLARLYHASDDKDEEGPPTSGTLINIGRPSNIVTASKLRGTDWVAQYSGTSSSAAISSGSNALQGQSKSSSHTPVVSESTVSMSGPEVNKPRVTGPSLVPLQQIEAALRGALKTLATSAGPESQAAPSTQTSSPSSDAVTKKRGSLASVPTSRSGAAGAGASGSAQSQVVKIGEFTSVLTTTLTELKVTDLLPYFSESDISVLQQAISDAYDEYKANARLGEGARGILSRIGAQTNEASESNLPLPERQVETTITVNTTLEYIKALRATRSALRLCAEREAQARLRAAARVKACPSLHKAMDEALCKLDTGATGRIPHDAFIRFLGGLELGLVSSEIRNIYELAPRVPSVNDPHPEVLYQVFQMCYQQVIQEALKNRELESTRNDVGIYLLDLMTARHSAYASAVASAISSGTLPPEHMALLSNAVPSANQGSLERASHTGAGAPVKGSMVPFAPTAGVAAFSEPRPSLPPSWARDVLVKDATRVRLSQLQVYALFRGVGRKVQYVPASANGTGSLGVGNQDQPKLSSAITDYLSGQVPLDIAGFTRLASIVIYSIYEDALAKSGLAGAVVSGLGLNQVPAASTPHAASQATPGSGAPSVRVPDGTSTAKVGETKEERELRKKFVEFDADDDDRLDAEEFSRCLSAEPELRLSAEQIALLRDAADLNRDGYVDWPEFLYFGTNILPNLYKDPLVRVQPVSHHSQQVHSSPLITGGVRIGRLGVGPYHSVPQTRQPHSELAESTI